MLSTYEFLLSSKHLCVEVSLREVPESPLLAPGGCKFSLDRVQLVVDILTNYVFETMYCYLADFCNILDVWVWVFKLQKRNRFFSHREPPISKTEQQKNPGGVLWRQNSIFYSIVVIVSNPSVPNNKISIRIHFQEVRIPMVCKTWNIFLTIFESLSI